MIFAITELEELELQNTIKSGGARRIIEACMRKNKIMIFGKKARKVFKRIKRNALIKKYSTTLSDEFFEDYLMKLEDIGICDKEILKFRKVREMKK
ncbi:MAG: hypothetical protein A3E21_09505 [Sulfurimonas sp. RIFCSPHIGHO2_12_FULL_36_9]|uniref:hypothetical protein n=1 Tax=Sulfurimonas sp. RIFCSPLOWO2_12_36_12 TaxID=1802253 RepID=UPI0008B02A42|nr:hypothetical protein [Sulfurimonas sp. RIFCSPLOWO2_12_36_12]OHD96736.1 MAG: hypothetical protein A3E21_09505 [Sulfurimonas sp. RIFCSPHIGHO2_12_FULL_36_9]OHE00294.1 MAG: hypothetical protein A3J26_06735 [Sulfurimonas sp. RIFCSPLOWO2_02_FULL_36_28]OHE02095.1 MAG: hypothetical protein A2W82_05270 [Sulfurimonas sp. RIFCSPLOWO2_12_36_12]